MFYRFICMAVIAMLSGGYMPVLVAEPLSSVWLSYTEDEDDVKDAFLDLFLGVNEDDTFSFSIGQSRSEFLGTEVNSNYYHVGYETLRMAPSSLKLFYEYWGESQEFEIHTTALNYGFHAEHVSLGLNLEYREINLFTRTFISGQRKFDISSHGYGPELFVYSGNMIWFAQAMWYDYSDNAEPIFTLTALFPNRALFILGRKSYDRAGTVNDWEVLTGLQYKLDAIMLGAQYMKSRSAIDNTISETYALTLRADVSDAWVLELTGGQVNDEDSDPIFYGGIGIGYRF